MTKYRLVKEDELRFMLRGYLKYLALQSGGVDNWEWCGESCADFLDGAGAEDFDELAEREIKELGLEEVED